MNVGRHGRAPALVLGAGLNGLGVARSLSAAGVPVYLADTDINRPEMRTRHACKLQLPALHGEPLIRELTSLAEARFSGRRPVLLLTQEQTVRTLAAAQEVLRPGYRFLLPSSRVIETLMHKQGFNRLAAETGLRVPRTMHVRGEADVEAALLLSRTLIVKPALHALEYERYFRKAYRIENPDEARILLGRILAVLPDVVVQEWIPGNDADLHFCLQHLSRDGHAVASFVGRKIRSWPPNVGGTASCTGAPEAEELSAITARFFARVGMRGLAGMEYKRHAVSGEFIAIEPTVGRTDYQEEVSTLNGVNLPYAYYCSVLDADFCSYGRAGAPMIWCDRQADRQSSVHPDQSVRGWPEGHGAVRDALWRGGDPGPWLATQWRRAMRKGGSICHRIFPDLQVL